MSAALFSTLSLLPAASSLLLPVASPVPRVALRLPVVSTVPRAVTLRRAIVTMQDQPASVSEQDEEISAPAAQDEELSAKQLEVVAEASDPFRFVRMILYGIFSVVGLAGAGIAVSQGDMVNAGVNAGVLVGGVVAFVLDQKFQEMLQAKVKQEMDDPYLKGDMRQEAPNED
jgi:hypothetical protein